MSVTPGQAYTIVVGAAGAMAKTTFAASIVAADYGVSGAQGTAGSGGWGAQVVKLRIRPAM